VELRVQTEDGAAQYQEEKQQKEERARIEAEAA
jgi:hypothetical protein